MKYLSTRLSSLVAAFAFLTLAHADAPAPNRGQARYEVGFMSMMIDHHNMALEMAMLCEGRTVHPELQQMCDNVISAQTAEIAEFQTWLNAWYGVQHEPVMKRSDERMLARLAALNGEEFEKAFMPALIKHHSIAIARAQVCEKRAFHEELIARCQSIVESQSAEIAQLRDWLCQWYQKCRGNRGNRQAKAEVRSASIKYKGGKYEMVQLDVDCDNRGLVCHGLPSHAQPR